MAVKPYRQKWKGTMTDRERFNNQMHYKPVDRSFNMEFGYWDDNFKTWDIFVENGITNNAEADVFFGFDASQKESWWYEGAVIYRHVRLVCLAPVHVAQWGTSVATSNITAQTAAVDVKTRITNETDDDAANCRLISTIVDMQGNAVAEATTEETVPAQSERELQQMLTVSAPRLWSPDSPYLYTVLTRVELDGVVVDTYQTPLGIRTYHFDPQEGFFLNGKHLKLRGMCNHDDLACLGVAVPERVHIKNIEMMKEVGANFLRCAHNPPSPETLDACDRLGVLVWNETRYFGDSEFELESLREMINRDRNHPSVIIWSMGNEEAKEGTPVGTSILKEMNELAHREDPTRVTAIAQSHKFNEAGFSDVADIHGYNWRDWESIDADHELFPKRVKLVSEYSFALGRGWDEIAVRRYIPGGSMWSGYTYRGELDWPNVSWPGHIADICRFPMPGYYIARALWRKEPVMKFFLDNEKMSGVDSDQTSFYGYSNCDSVEVFAGGQLCAVLKPKGSRNRPRGEWLTEDVTFAGKVDVGSNVALRFVGSVAGKPVCEQQIEPLGKPARIQLTADRECIAADGQDVSLITASIVDANGSPISTADSLVTVAVEGAGRLIGIGNADSTDREPNKSNRKTTCGGRCLVVVQSTSQSGEFRVKAVSQSGLSSNELVVRTDKNVSSYVEQPRIKESVPTQRSSDSTEYLFRDLELSARRVKPNQAVEATAVIENVGSFYPRELELLRWGKGRVFYCSLGHHADIVAMEPVKTIMRRGFLWAADGRE